MGGELEAINRTFNAPNIINVLPADVITSLPNANVADAIGRLPDVTLERDEGEGKYVKVRGTDSRLTHTTLDGVTLASPELVRQLKLDLIPADLVEPVQINKTLQANMEGSGIGGSVDLRTKSAEDRPTLDLEGLGGYDPIIGGRNNYQFDGTAGRRFLGSTKRLGVLFSGSYDWNGRGINDVEPGPALVGTYDLRDYRYFRARGGLGGTVDYRLSDTFNLFLKTLYAKFGYQGTSRSGTPGTTPIRAQYSYIDLLPGASLRYALTPRQGIRLVYSRGLARPDFQDLIPFESSPSGGTARPTVSQGNPYLNSEYADDIDLLYENNLGGSGLLQTGFYYKNLVNPIVSTQSVAGPDFIVTTPHIVNGVLNAGSAYVFGFEIAYIQHFTQLPSLLGGLGVSANYGYTNSAAHLPPYVDPDTLATAPVGTVSGPNRGPEGANPQLIGQAPNSFNFSPTYDRHNLSVRLGMTYNQANIAAYQYTTDNNGPMTQGGGGGGPKGPNGDNYFYSHLQVDLQGCYRLPKGFTAVRKEGSRVGIRAPV